MRGHDVSSETTDAERLVKDPVFSILVPSYNAAPYIGDALRSALDQMGPDDELLVQDAGSTDGAQAVIAQFAEDDSRVKPVVEPDLGQSDALNKALARAKPSWVIWLNSDDVLLPGALAALKAVIPEHPEADLFYGGHRILKEDGASVDFFPGREMDLKKLLRQGITSFSGSIVMRDTTLRELGGIKVALHCAMDYDLQMRIARRDLTQVNVPAAIGALRFHDASKSANLWKGFVRESHRVRMEYSHSLVERLCGLWGTAWHTAEIPFFRLRLSPTYRRLRRRLPAQLR